MRIGTWNLAGQWGPKHERLLVRQNADVWLLTEVSERLRLEGYHAHMTQASMAARRRWAGVFSKHALVPLADPHPASSTARVGRLQVCSSILPWRSTPARDPWVGSRHVDKTEHAVRQLLSVLPTQNLVWGGDWNHALSGTEYAGSQGGRAHVLDAIDKLGLQVPTAALPHRIDGLLSIDHVAVPQDWTVADCLRIVASHEDKRLSDHDAYIVDVVP